MDYVNLSPMDRIRSWKDFRETINDEQDIEDQLITVQEYWNKYPISTISIDIDTPDQWPTPWEIVHSNTICDFSKVYLMEQTLIMADDDRYTPDSLRLMYIEDRALSEAQMVLVHDNKYVLNYEHNQIINFDIVVEKCIITQEYTVSNQHQHCIKK